MSSPGTAMATIAPDGSGVVTAFISYSRKDIEFALKLTGALHIRNIRAIIDTRDLPTLEDWRRELLLLISQADNVIFLASPNSILSPVCSWELEQTRLHGKRLAPVVVNSVASVSLPDDIARITWIDFSDGVDFERKCDELANALARNIGWIHHHTHIGQRALAWTQSQNSSDHLLRGAELSQAQEWLLNQPRQGPFPTELQLEYIRESASYDQLEQARIMRERNEALALRCETLIAFSNDRRHSGDAVTAMLLAIEAIDVLAPVDGADQLTVYEKANDALVAALYAQQEVFVARVPPNFDLQDDELGGLSINPATSAITSFGTPGELVRRRFHMGTSNGRALPLAQDTGADSKALLCRFSPPARLPAARLGIEKIRPDFESRMLAIGVRAFWRRREISLDMRNVWQFSELVASPNLHYFVCGGTWKGRAYYCLGDTAGRKMVATLGEADFGRFSVSFSPDGQAVATAGPSNSISIWHGESGTLQRQLFGHQKFGTAVSFSDDGRILASAGDDGLLNFWDVESGRLLRTLCSDWTHKAIRFEEGNASVVTCTADAMHPGVIQKWSVAPANTVRIVPATATCDSAHYDAATDSDEYEPPEWPAVTCSIFGASGHFSIEAAEEGKDTFLRVRESHRPDIYYDIDLSGCSRIDAVVTGGGADLVVVAPLQANFEIPLLIRRWSLPDRRWVQSADFGLYANYFFQNDGSAIWVISNEGVLILINPETLQVVTQFDLRPFLDGEPEFRPWDITGILVADDRRSIELLCDKGITIVVGLISRSDALKLAKENAPRLLTPAQRSKFGLSAQPPFWYGKSMRWPYDTAAWREWFSANADGKTLPMPEDEDNSDPRLATAMEYLLGSTLRTSGKAADASLVAERLSKRFAGIREQYRDLLPK